MARPQYPHLTAEEKAIKFGLTQPAARAAVYLMPRPSRHAYGTCRNDAACISRRGDAETSPRRRHLLSRPVASTRRDNDAVVVELLATVPIPAGWTPASVFEQAIVRATFVPGDCRVNRSPVRRVRIEDNGPVALQMTRITSTGTHDDSESNVTLFFGIVSANGQQLRMARVIAANNTALRQHRGAVAVFLRRWATSTASRPQETPIYT